MAGKYREIQGKFKNLVMDKIKKYKDAAELVYYIVAAAWMAVILVWLFIEALNEPLG